MGSNMVAAGLTVKDKSGHSTLTPEQEPEQLSIAEKRITAMCIDAALTEDDFETAYTYVVNRLAAIGEPAVAKNQNGKTGVKPTTKIVDDWSWKAALQTGKYRRTSRTVRPTHLGTASGNPDIRHLEQRIECLATALRIAPAATLQEILNTYRRCEEELDSAIKAEAEQEEAWDEAGDFGAMPGGFDTAPALRNATESSGRQASSRQPTEEAPMSLFDLSRASVRSAQRNFTALSNLRLTTEARSSETPHDSAEYSEQQQQRVRKRDQLRDATMGTLVSGVGWLIGAQPQGPGQERE